MKKDITRLTKAEHAAIQLLSDLGFGFDLSADSHQKALANFRKHMSTKTR